MDIEELKVGDWVLLEFGGTMRPFYVHGLTRDFVMFGRSSWLVSDYEAVSKADLQYNRKIDIIGHSKKKWYWRFLPWRNCVCPYYAPEINY